MGGCVQSKTRIVPKSIPNDAFARPKTAVPAKAPTSTQLKTVCPSCGRDDRVIDVVRFCHVGFYDSGFMADYYYDFGGARFYVGKRTGFCFFRPTNTTATYICDVKH